MRVEVLARDLLVGGVEPFDLTESRRGGLEVGKVDSAGLVVVWEVAEFPSVRSDLNDGEGRVGKAGDPRAAPLLG